MKRNQSPTIIIACLVAVVVLGALAGCGGGGNKTPVPVTPSAPTLTAADSQLTVTWNTVNGATSYEVWFNTVNDTSTAAQFTGDSDNTDITCVITGLTNGTTYYIWVRAKNSAGTSGFSPVASGIPAASIASPDTPGTPSLTAGNHLLIVTWTPVNGATSYEVWFNTANDTSTAAQFTGDSDNTDTTCIITDLTNGTTYYVWIKAKNSLGTSGFSLPGSGNPTVPVALSAPTGLTAAGALGCIQLSWNASNGDGLQGYNIYRSTNVVDFVKLNASPVSATAYDDPISSPAGDGVWYYYKVTAAGALESGFSNSVRSMHGTRLAASYANGFITQVKESPYVAEGTTVVDGDNLTVATSTKLYVLDNTTIALEAGRTFQVSGLLRVLASSGAAHATFTAHKSGGGVLGDGEGFFLKISNAVSYDPADDSGTVIQHTRIENLKESSAVTINGCGVKFHNSYIVSNKSTGGSYFYIYGNNSWITMRNCRLEKSILEIGADMRGKPCAVERNVFRGGYYSIYFNNLSNPGVSPGQIAQNDFDGSKTAYLSSSMSGGGQNVPLGSNYWHGGTSVNPGDPPLPNVYKGELTIDFDFSNPSPALTRAPAGAGPDW